MKPEKKQQLEAAEPGPKLLKRIRIANCWAKSLGVICWHRRNGF